jgi:F-type H+-transporting ATPase subunit epsilon
MAAEHMVDVEVLTPEGEVFSGEVRQVSTRTAVGELGILANHTPLLAALKPTELRLHVNHAKLLLEEAIAPDELDQATLKEQLADAEQRLTESGGGGAEARAQKDRERAEAFLAIAQG